jgi:hypothetical protein
MDGEGGAAGRRKSRNGENGVRTAEGAQRSKKTSTASTVRRGGEPSFESRGVWELYTESCEGGSLVFNAPAPRSTGPQTYSLHQSTQSQSTPFLYQLPILLLPSTWKGRYVIVSGNTSNATNTFLLAWCTRYACMGVYI